MLDERSFALLPGGNMTTTVRGALAFLGAAAMAACSRNASMIPAASPPASKPAAGAAPSRVLPNDIRWFRTAAEYRALARQAYTAAGDHLAEASRGLAAGRWGVILDADETIIDNSEYERRRFAADSGYTDASWLTWVQERAAPAVPGAVEFTRRVRSLGGRVVVVSKRADSLCAPTRANLSSIGLV
ncbi:MAG: HAD family acid phosphatase, partial [Gemmatimonadales bacterium]